MFKSYSINDKYLEVVLDASKYSFIEALMEEFFEDKYTCKWVNQFNAYVVYEYEPFVTVNFDKLLTIYFHALEDKTKAQFLCYILDKYKDFIDKCETSLYPIQD